MHQDSQATMPSVEELSQTIQAALGNAGIDAAKTIERSPGSTIVPARPYVDTAGERAIGVLNELGGTSLSRKLELLGTIGEGGMGVVRLGQQLALGREVAVKSLKAEHKKDEGLMLKLLREAWVTGGLEHPNIIPVYDIALEPDGTPLIILKKIEGVDWGTLMHDARTVRERFGEGDLLEWNLRTFMQVCNAVRFAHVRRVLHRDLKPENVMIGQFGEVYVVDWGIAVSLENDGTGRLPLASEALEMAGTPLYMAPEMLGGKESRLSERTDVYLLGAILCEIVSGEPPHCGETTMEIISSIIESEPKLPEDAPAELVRIVRCAMDPDPDARFENADQVRLAVQGFLQHRDASRLAHRAEERLVELEHLLAKQTSAKAEPEDRESIYHVFGECRFGFRHALEVWPGNDQAERALDRAVEAMIGYELAQSEPEAARALLSEMDRVPPELAQRVALARANKDREEAQLRALSDDHDPTVGRRTRFFVASIVGALWSLTPLGGAIWVELHPGEFTAATDVLVGLGFLGVLLGLGVWARESMMRTAINRRLSYGAVLAVCSHVISSGLAWALDGSIWHAIQQQFLVWGVLTAMAAAVIDWRLLIAAAGYLAAHVVTPFIGYERAFYPMSASNFLLLLVVIALWARPKEDIAAARQGILRRRAKRKQWLAERFGRKRDGEADSDELASR
jgi:eukaryotic-like serine/threonine-protein kinase